ncbi:hypothetical protein LOD99_10552 [Oopsacas minuta]|uniref:Uncharacterized protein n=1 Tax=Oopsacas minuta TaxID=111878 RepID=A0AAV7KHJ1_9METZ|nr:hypothetical protein LOD99_10552 [Oopsacas minuta]
METYNPRGSSRGRRGRSVGQNWRDTHTSPYRTRSGRPFGPQPRNQNPNQKDSSQHLSITTEQHPIIQDAQQIASGKNLPPTIVPAQKLKQHPELASLCQIRQAIPNNLKNLLADTFLAAYLEAADKPIPEELLYTSTSEQQNPYLIKASSLGLSELVLQNGERETFQANNPEVANLAPMFKHPALQNVIETLVLVQSLAELELYELHKNILKSIVIQRLSTHPLLTKAAQGPKTHTYAQIAGTDAGTARKQPFKFIPKIKPCPNTQYPCTHCVNASAMLAGAKQKHMESIHIQATKKDVDTIALSLPANLRENFKELYKVITLDHPNHTERYGCPLSPSLNKQASFYNTTENPHHEDTKKAIGYALVKTCLQYGMCAKCGKPRNLQNSSKHFPDRLCHITERVCPDPNARECKARNCTHEVAPENSIWTQQTLTLKPLPSLATFDIPNF